MLKLAFDAKRAEASYGNGGLTMTLPKKAGVRSGRKRIPIKMN
jgi:HSP20 family molecular chaperone IbpA